MPLSFPTVKEVVLLKSPLTEVIYQVRFPQIWSIGTEVPVDLQERVRHRFPEVEEEQSASFTFPMGQLAAHAEGGALDKTFHFRTADGISLLSVGVDAYAVSTSKYSTWEEFAKDIQLANRSMTEVYQIPYAKRIGLRYINSLAGYRYGADSLQELSKLLRPQLAPVFDTSVAAEVEETVSTTLFRGRDDPDRLVMRVAGRRAIERTGNSEVASILLDFDNFEEGQLSIEALSERADHFHDQIYRAFRWSLSETGLRAFEPSGGK